MTLPSSPLKPCIKVCVMHPQTKLCVGCFRTLEEIGTWKRMSDDQKRAIVQKAPERARAHAVQTARPSGLREHRKAMKKAEVLAQEALDAKKKRLAARLI